MGKIKDLPSWIVKSKNPAFDDTDSATAIEMVAKLYETMQENIKDTNEFLETIENQVDSIESFTKKDVLAFKIAIEQKFNDFTKVLNTKYSYLDYMLQNVENLIKDLNEGRGE